ncbi:Tc5 transposase DNA-binding domain-containing protein [Hirsutella rhossiliensis]|uniref:Tc5 transposase DNA-binding domain-containing protein n=1 Tax=Hirsutella rhossiliensis TaxID=111463 RepID=A0A9P8MVB4_9HYPO|nr:tc5 transposase DNA-binding domain-containing protein [Hirsutella rhossiliensis]KAH0962773.1 tc5 transposase DNA-binding domain-containing protein [Hirsutella rhossiliensis]
MHFLLFRGFQTQEKQLTEWILIQDALGLPPTHSQIRQFAQRMLAVKGDHTPLGKHWMQAFLRRNPAVRPRSAITETLSVSTALLPRYNMDEAGIMEGLGENGLVVGSAENDLYKRRRLVLGSGRRSSSRISQPPDRFKPSRQAKLSFLLPESTRASAHCVKHQGWLESDGFVAGVDGEATLSPLLLENSNRRKKNAKNVANAFNSHLPTSDWQSDTSQIAWSTPRRSQDLKVQVVQFNQLDDDVPTKRLLFRKITKGFDEKDGLLAKAQLQIQALETQLAAVKPKKKEEGGHEPEFEVRQY